jgi:hypothetical protein
MKELSGLAFRMTFLRMTSLTFSLLSRISLDDTKLCFYVRRAIKKYITFLLQDLRLLYIQDGMCSPELSRDVVLLDFATLVRRLGDSFHLTSVSCTQTIIVTFYVFNTNSKKTLVTTLK